jgi:hypothetical protein
LVTIDFIKDTVAIIEEYRYAVRSQELRIHEWGVSERILGTPLDFEYDTQYGSPSFHYTDPNYTEEGIRSIRESLLKRRLLLEQFINAII